jgi:hypothetical protein
MNDGDSRGDAAHVDTDKPATAERYNDRIFKSDPLGSARRTLCEWAERAAVMPARSKVQAMGRRIAADNMVMCLNPDPDVSDEASKRQVGAIAMLIEEPSQNLSDLATKLAALHQMMAIEANSTYVLSRLELGLVGSMLADAVLLQAGPMTFPEECKQPISTPEDVERWRLRAIDADKPA